VWKKEESRPQGVADISTASTPTVVAGNTNSAIPVSPRAPACISQGIKIKGEVTGKEDLFVDGVVEGKLDLAGGSVTVGPNGKIKADISAREVIVRGHVVGKVFGRERVQLWSTGHVEGEVQTERLAIEDGAVFRGRAEAGRMQSKAKEVHASAPNLGDTALPNPMAVSSGTTAI
jgi:cytoskeletal protein CcmA (bactofilin family)